MDLGALVFVVHISSTTFSRKYEAVSVSSLLPHRRTIKHDVDQTPWPIEHRTIGQASGA